MIIKEDPKLVNAAKFTFIKEDHTIGNLLRSELLKIDEIRFAGYRMPHPLENLLELKVQTNGDIDPITAVKRVTNSRLQEVKAIEEDFKVCVVAMALSYFLSKQLSFCACIEIFGEIQR